MCGEEEGRGLESCMYVKVACRGVDEDKSNGNEKRKKREGKQKFGKEERNQMNRKTADDGKKERRRGKTREI